MHKDEPISASLLLGLMVPQVPHLVLIISINQNSILFYALTALKTSTEN